MVKDWEKYHEFMIKELDKDDVEFGSIPIVGWMGLILFCGIVLPIRYHFRKKEV